MPAESVKHIPENSLIDSLKKKNKESFDLLFDKYSPALFGLIMGITGDLNIAEDVLQRTFITIWRTIGEFEPSNQRFFTWVLGIARKQAQDACKKTKINIPLKIHNEPDSVSVNTVLILICLKGYSFEEAARVLKVSDAQIRIMFKNELHHYKTIINK